MTARAVDVDGLMRREDQGGVARVWGVLRSGSSRLLYSPHIALLLPPQASLLRRGRSFGKFFASCRGGIGRVCYTTGTPPLQALRHRINYRNDHLIVGRFLESLCDRAF
jgi:hypothetical protein